MHKFLSCIAFFTLFVYPVFSFTPLERNKFIKQSTSNEIISNIVLGKKYYNNHLYTEAIKHFILALEETEDVTTIISVKQIIAEIYLQLEKFSASENHAREALHLSKKENLHNEIASSYLLLGHVKEKQGSYLEAIQYLNTSIQKFNAYKNSLGVAKCNLQIGSIYEDLNQYHKAESYFRKAYIVFKETNTIEECDILNNLGDSYRKQGNYVKSIDYTNQSLLLAQKLEDENLLKSAYKDLSKAHFAMENYKKAYTSLIQSESYNEIAFQKRNTNQINLLQSRYNAEKRQAEIAVLRAKNKVSNVNQKLLIAALIILLSYLVLVRYIFHKKRKAKLKIQQYEAQILKAELDKKQATEKNLQQDIQTKTISLSKYSLHLSQKNKMLSEVSKKLKNISQRNNLDTKAKLKELSKEIDFSLKQENDWINFDHLFQDIHPEFAEKLAENTKEKLSPAELKLSMLLRLNLSSKEIANILRVTPDSIRVARYRLRKKLPIDPKQELVHFMRSI